MQHGNIEMLEGQPNNSRGHKGPTSRRMSFSHKTDHRLIKLIGLPAEITNSTDPTKRCHEIDLLDNLHHKSGYQIDLQCFLRFLLAILKQLSFCSVGTLDMAERSKEDNKPI